MDYLRELTAKVRLLQGCKAVHVKTVPVTEVFRGKVAWDGEVEVFDLTGHAKAKRCYAWGFLRDTRRNELEVVAVLEIPPVDSPESAVRVAIASHARVRGSIPPH